MMLMKSLDELEAAMRNRKADAAAMVFAGRDACPSTEPFQPFDHKAIVVLDKHGSTCPRYGSPACGRGGLRAARNPRAPTRSIRQGSRL
jgi:hypothetical protein